MTSSGFTLPGSSAMEEVPAPSIPRSARRHVPEELGYIKEEHYGYSGEAEGGNGEVTGEGEIVGEGDVGRNGIRRSAITFVKAINLLHFMSKLLSFKAMLLISLVLFTVLPATTMWLISRGTIQAGIESGTQLGQQMVQDVSLKLRKALIANVTIALLQYLQPAERALQMTLDRFEGDGFTRMDPSEAAEGFWLMIDKMSVDHVFHVVKTAPSIQFLGVCLVNDVKKGRTNKTQSWPWQQYYITLQTPQRCIMYQRHGTNLRTSQLEQRIYGVFQTLTHIEENQKKTTFTFYDLDQATGKPTFQLAEVTSPGIDYVWLDVTQDEFRNWDRDLSYFPIPNIVVISLEALLPVKAPRVGALAVTISIYVYKISTFLANSLSNPKDRMFLFFRSDTGYLIGASHGKYTSISDKDSSSVQPTLGEVRLMNQSDFQRYTPIEATDHTIRVAAEWLLATFHAWDSIPDLHELIFIAMDDYWISTCAITSELGLKVELVLLVDVGSKLGPIRRNLYRTMEDITDMNNELTIFLCVVVICAFGLGVLIHVMITRSLVQLERGMEKLAVLQYSSRSQKSLLGSRSWLTEVAECQRSFVMLERGIKAFDKYVPRAIVRMMLCGQLELTSMMFRKTITIMFTDIAGFTALAETLPPKLLQDILCEYIAAMCGVIVSHEGTLDKFIGDCIMAMWNAPRSKLEHEAAACDAALGMQPRLLLLCQRWQEGLKIDAQIRFRMGINTAVVLVGNYGCEYRINYTCLGDGVNVANGLEAMNKSFGSVVMVAKATRDAAKSRHFFRKLGHVMLPGKTKIIEIYELLYASSELGPRRGSDGSEIFSRSDSRNSGRILGELIERTPSQTSQSLIDDRILFHWDWLSRESIHRIAVDYEKALELFQEGCFQAAEKIMTEVMTLTGVPDKACQLLCEQCQLQQRWVQESGDSNSEHCEVDVDVDVVVEENNKILQALALARTSSLSHTSFSFTLSSALAAEDASSLGDDTAAATASATATSTCTSSTFAETEAYPRRITADSFVVNSSELLQQQRQQQHHYPLQDRLPPILPPKTLSFSFEPTFKHSQTMEWDGNIKFQNH